MGGYDESYEVNEPWSTGLCSCFDDCGLCCYTTFCMGCNIRRNAAYIQGRQPECFDYVLGTAMCLFPYVGGLIMSIHACYNRNEIKKQYGIDGGEFNCCDCFTGSSAPAAPRSSTRASSRSAVTSPSPRRRSPRRAPRSPPRRAERAER